MMMKVLGFMLLAIGPAAFGQNIVANGGFEKEMSGWQEHVNGNAGAKGRIDRTERHSGTMSFHLTNASNFAPQVYYRIFRQQAVKPNTTYLIGAWTKGTGVGKCWIGGGLPTDWHLKRQFPAGDYDWQWSAVEYTTGPDQTVFELMVLTESPTRDLWVDDILMAPVDKNLTGLFYEPTVQKGLSPAARFYPALPASERARSPVVRMRMNQDPSFGFDAKITWDAEKLIVDVDVLDSTAGDGNVRLVLDVQPEKAKDGLSASCYDLGFAIGGDGKIIQHAEYAGGVDAAHWPDLDTQVRRTAAGYHLTIHVPWNRFRLQTAEPPRVLGMNLLVGDGESGSSKRRRVAWVEAAQQSPDRFARVLRTSATDRVGYVLFTGKPVYDRKDWMIGRLVEYTFKAQPAEKVVLACGSDAGNALFDWGTVAVPPAPAGSTRSFDFLLPLTSLEREDSYRILAGIGPDRIAEVSFVRTDLSVRVADLLQNNEDRVRRIKDRTKDRSPNRYVETGLTIAERFIRRVKPDANGKEPQSADWSMRQMNEVAGVLDETEKFLAAGTPFDSPRPTGGPVEIRKGVFYTQTSAGERPFYFGGFGHFSLVGVESPLLQKMGYSLIQQECGPASLSADNQLDGNGQAKLAAVKLASDNSMKVVFLLSPHYFPQWAIDKAPEVVVPGGFNGFDVNHPIAREAIGRWIDFVVAKTKDEPSILAYDLMNEPTYTQSGRTAVSRPLWIAYLQNRHKTIASLNAMYGTKYSTFDQVLVPPVGYPETLAARRAYYDWIVFNHANFADWFRFMHDRVKQRSPRSFTQAKLMDNIFTYGLIGAGIDPERICTITDIAGNDCWTLWPGGDYAYCWLQMELWYDLLHSFKGQPVANTENHILPDGSGVGDQFPPAHTYAVYWQGALHHQGAQATWLWEEPTQPFFEGQISLRPANVHAGARAMLDLNRLAREATAVNQAEPQVAILYSVPSIFWEKDLEETTKKVYTALNFLGLKITFISERQLAEGSGPKVGLILLPHATHVKHSTLKALQDFTTRAGKLLAVGDHCLAFDEYHRPHPQTDQPSIEGKLESALHEKAMAERLRSILTKNGLNLAKLTDVETEKSVWGVEFRIVPYHDTILIPMINMLPQPQTVKLPFKGSVIDLISGQPVDPARMTLEPMVPCLLSIPKKERI